MGQFKAKKPRTGFNRPQSNMSSEVNREWRNTKVRDLKVDDIIAGMGIVKTSVETCDGQWYIEAGESTDDFFDPEMGLLAFVRKVD